MKVLVQQQLSHIIESFLTLVVVVAKVVSLAGWPKGIVEGVLRRVGTVIGGPIETGRISSSTVRFEFIKSDTEEVLVHDFPGFWRF